MVKCKDCKFFSMSICGDGSGRCLITLPPWVPSSDAQICHFHDDCDLGVDPSEKITTENEQ